MGITKIEVNMASTDKTRKDILHRAKIIEGHIKKVFSMIEDNEYCIDILNQSYAVQSAMKKLDEVILEDHLKNCVTHKIKAGQGDEAAKEVLEVFRRRA